MAKKQPDTSILTTPTGEQVVLTARGGLTGAETVAERRRFFEQLIPETWHRVAFGTGNPEVDRRRAFNTTRQDIISMSVERLEGIPLAAMGCKCESSDGLWLFIGTGFLILVNFLD